MGLMQQYFSDEDHRGDEPFKDVDLHSWSSEELQVLSPRRKVLVDMEKALDIKIPATRKMHTGRDWKKSSPNISNEDLFQIARGLFRELGKNPEVALSIKKDIVSLSNGERSVYQVLDSSDEFFSVQEIAEQVDVSESTVRDYICSLRRKMSFQEKVEGLEGGGYRKKYRLPPTFRDLDVGGERP